MHIDAVGQSLEMTRLMLGNGKYRGVVCSTLAEIEGVSALVKEGILDDVSHSSNLQVNEPNHADGRV